MGLYCDHTFEDVDTLLKRDWALDVEDIRELLNELPLEIYDKVAENMLDYSRRVRDLFPMRVPTRLKVSNFTDEMMEKKMNDDQDKLDKWVREHKNSFIPPLRPREVIDDWIDDISSKIEKKKLTLEEMIVLTNKTKKYVPPGQRGLNTEEPMIRDTRAELKVLENEFNELMKQMDVLNKTWTELTWIDAIIAEKRR